MPLIHAEKLHKSFQVAKRTAGMWGALKSLVHREYITKAAVEEVSFSIEAGEMVGYIGPNGAGKSTTIKMLTGILVPTSGEVMVNGLVPYRDRRKNASQIGVVFGQRTQLWWDLPVIDSLELLKQIYRVPDERYKMNLETFDDILDLGSFLHTPVRQLSLGQRMRADVAAALLHDPEILYLDEPTIGLDIVAKEKIRQFIQQINRDRRVTVILTTHDMVEIEKLCTRMILIDHGRVVYDGRMDRVKERFGQWRILVVELDHEAEVQLPTSYGEVVRSEGVKHWIRFNGMHVSASQLISFLSTRFSIRDLSVQEPDIESILRSLYTRQWQAGRDKV